MVTDAILDTSVLIDLLRGFEAGSWLACLKVAGSFGSSPFEPLQDLVRQRRVEVVRDLERPGAEAKRTRTGLRGGDGPQLGDRSPATNHAEVFPGLNPVQQAGWVPLELL